MMGNDLRRGFVLGLIAEDGELVSAKVVLNMWPSDVVRNQSQELRARGSAAPAVLQDECGNLSSYLPSHIHRRMPFEHSGERSQYALAMHDSSVA